MKIHIDNLTAKMKGFDLNIYQEADALVDFNRLVDYVDKLESDLQKAEKIKQLLKEIQLYETDSNDAWVTNVLKMIDEELRGM